MQIQDISATDNTMTFSAAMAMAWTDHRFAYDNLDVFQQSYSNFRDMFNEITKLWPFLKISATTVVLNVSNSPHTGSKHPDFVHISLI